MSEADSLQKLAQAVSRPRSAVAGDSRNLDFLRAVAVLCVLAAHLSLFLIKLGYIHPGAQAGIWDIFLNFLGHLGVLFFFVHTALVLMLSLDRSKSTGMVVNFYLRRVFRIYPLCIACIGLVLLFKIPQDPEVLYVPWDAHEIVANLFLVQNIFKKPDVIMPLWTLPREVQMYVALPFLYMLLKRIPSSLVVMVAWVAFFAAVPKAPILSCFPCFMGGVFAYQLAKEKTFRLKSFWWPLVLLGLTALTFILYITVLPDYRSDFMLCMLLGLMIPNVVDLAESRLTQVSRTIAKYSYGIYLFHEPAMWFSFIKLGFLPLPLKWAVLISLVVAVPVAAFHFLEGPLIEVGRRVALRWTAAYSRYRLPKSSVLTEQPVSALR